tara:strand:+ start:579 stop:842 length:264 start_codon:yes stop_codon:yes gene_type:complete
MKRIHELRKQIDKLDKELILNFKKRLIISKKISEIKGELGIDNFDSKREIIIIKKALETSFVNDMSNEISRFMKSILRISKEYQNRK